MADLARRISELSPHKRELLLRRLGQQPAAARVQPILPAPRPDHIPLSFAQQRLWFLNQLAPDSAFYNASTAIRFPYAVDVSALERALNEIVRRHEALRTAFPALDGEPVQAIAPALDLPLPTTDLRGLAARETEARRLATEEARRPFDLARGPLIRTSLLRLEETEYWFLLTMHHIVSDGWSTDVFFDELFRLYSAFRRNEPSLLKELPIQYADFAIWQRDWLRGDVYQRQLAYWRAKLQDLPALDLPADRRRPAALSYRGAHQPITLPGSLAHELRALAEHEGATLFMTLAAAFVVLLHRYTGAGDIVIGTPIANRTRAEIEPLIGFFVNSLVLRVDASGDPSFRELLARVREVALGAYAHQDLPFEKLVEELHPRRDLSRNPLFQVMFQLLTELRPAAAGSQQSGVTPVAIERGTTQFDIAFDLWAGADGIGGQVEYSTDLFNHSTIARLLGHYRTLLEAAVANPAQPISTLPMLTGAERRLVTVDWNETAAAFPHTCIHQLFEAQAVRTPDSPALIAGNRTVTFSELNARANQLAHHLIQMGVTPGTRVCVSLDRSADLAVALLGVLKAGAAYVPIDPACPSERLAYMQADCSAPLTITGETLTAIGGQPGSNPSCCATPEDLAYAVYTSGSTGKPKGVLIPHSALVNHSVCVARRFQLKPDDRVLQCASLSFDVTAEEIFPTLLAGAAVVFEPHPLSLEPAEFLSTVERLAITVLNLPTPYWRLLIELPLPACLRLVVIGSQRASPADVALCARSAGARPALINAYGVSEATITTLLYPVTLEPLTEVPIGRPIDNVRAYVLDRRLQPVPIGVPGELYLGGACLAKGYLNQPELTSASFLPDPFSNQPGMRLYRTGDAARFLPDGHIEYVGRLDDQVKVNGFRIEPGEVEAALLEHPAVDEAVVLPSSGRLIAYIVEGRSVEDPSEQVSGWQALYDEIYAQPPPSGDPTFNTIGWNSSYTGLPLADSEMREWLDNTVERIAALNPRRVLEIGCGTGLVLFQIAPRVESYTATDFSPVALDYIRRHGPSNVRLFQCYADDFTPIAGETFDTIILNSVVQYFPSADYLKRVLERALDSLAAGGAIFVGDVRSLPLLEAFHESMERFRSPASPASPEFHKRVKKRVAEEQELVLDPRFFDNLNCSATVYPKAARTRNELTLFRYDVVLRAGSRAIPADPSIYANNPIQGSHKRRLAPRLRAFLKQKLPEYMVPSSIVLLDAMPIMPNGKLNRAALPSPDTVRPELSQTFVLPRTPAEETLARIWCELLGLEQVGVHDNFFELGGDSILSIQIIARANQAGLGLTPRQLFEHQTIAALAAMCATPRPRATHTITGDVPLTPIQQWFFEQRLADPHHFNQSVCLDVNPVFDFERALTRLVAHHDALRLRFTGGRQFYAARESAAIFSTVDLPDRAAFASFERQLQNSLDIENGPIIRAAICRFDGGASARLLIAVHHLAIDAVSWRILLDDLWAAGLPPKTSSYEQWATHLVDYAQSAGARNELDYWLAAVPRTLPPLPVDHHHGANTIADVDVVTTALEAGTLVTARIDHALLAALALAFGKWTAGQPLLVDVEGHGREDLFPALDLSRTVGWFTSVFPVCLDLPLGSKPADAVRIVSRQLHQLPNRGIGYGLLRYQCRDDSVRTQLAAQPQAQVSFNYLGRFTGNHGQSAPTSTPNIRSPRQQRSHLIEINSLVYGGRLEMSWYSSRAIHDRATIQALAGNFNAYLEAMTE